MQVSIEIPSDPGFYTVDSRFLDGDREAAWNVWYDAHIDGMIEHVPGFVSSQRFRKTEPRDREYFGLHTLGSGDVLTSTPYSSRGGTFPPQWLPLVTDWYRGFYIGVDRFPEVPHDHVLVVTDLTRAEVAPTGVDFVWVRGAALTPRTAQRGLAIRSREEGNGLAARYSTLVRVFAPITILKRQGA